MDEFPGGSKTGQCFFFFRDSSIFERPDVPYFKLYWLLCAKARNDDIGGERNNIKSLNGFSRHDSALNFKKKSDRTFIGAITNIITNGVLSNKTG